MEQSGGELQGEKEGVKKFEVKKIQKPPDPPPPTPLPPPPPPRGTGDPPTGPREGPLEGQNNHSGAAINRQNGDDDMVRLEFLKKNPTFPKNY